MDDEKARAANIFDVARLAGVSHQTVSRVLNDLPNVRPATRLRVEQAIKQLRYVPSPAARALVTRRSRTLGLITVGTPDYGPSSTALHFNEAAREARYAVSMASMLTTDAATMRAAVEMLLRQNVEAIVLIATDRAAVESVNGLELGVPLIAIAAQGSGGFHRVSLDQYQGARIAVERLIALGHREIRHIAGPMAALDAVERHRAWRDVLAENQLRVHELPSGDWSPASGYRIGAELAAQGGFTAVFVGNDQMALGLYHALSAAGLSVPADVSVIGFDDIPESGYFAPPLTTIRQDFESLGRDTMAAVLAALRDDESPSQLQRVPELIERESTAPPRARA
ncbi:LacI family DNA-binding transcriptional regulator [Microterricola pindariensis]|uniref:Transcriptional regulator n=1 Tax=Microterricola pindariensis TaxID=478010 RepID=A0ABX5AX18_9MICO|nr:LacI family DNA-binding transcriptional regulator [Microterricola pindariensis]PPL19473.1 transcriptional regulator [Microterricola pindariensis]